MSKKRSTKIPGLSFSAKRAVGITKLKSNIARKTGIPTSKAGRQRKVGKAVMGGGCLIYVVGGLLAVAGVISFIFI